MTQLHLIKLCVGVSSVEQLVAWQQQRLAALKKGNKPPVLDHVTRQTPKQADVLEGGSLYWVINGAIACRQKIIGFEPTLKNTIPHCRIVLSPDTLHVQPRPFRPFQGWRYLKAVDAPGDLALTQDTLHFESELRNIGVI